MIDAFRNRCKSSDVVEVIARREPTHRGQRQLGASGTHGHADGTPHSILPASQVVRFLVPTYVQDDPSLARVMNESMADRAGEKLGNKRVRDLLPGEPQELPVVNHDDTIIEVAAIMARLRSPLVAVMRDARLVGVISASRLLELALNH
jgi:CBS domain-containing protein